MHETIGADGATEPGPEVCLVFPPLVASNFGLIYPSLAVLSAYLDSHGIRSQQEDLNEEFALFLVETERLRSLGAGTAEFPQDSWAATSARWALSHRAEFFDGQGRFNFSEQTFRNNILRGIARPYAIDPDLENIRDSGLLPAASSADFLHGAQTTTQSQGPSGVAALLAASGLPQ